MSNTPIRLQDIAEIVGVSITTVSNVLNGKTKRVSQATIDKVKTVVDEYGYVPNMASRMLSSKVSKIIGVLLRITDAHGYYSTMDPFISEFMGAIEEEARKHGYYVMRLNEMDLDDAVAFASMWNIDGIIAAFYTHQQYLELQQKLDKPMILVDSYNYAHKEDIEQFKLDQKLYPNKRFQNIGINDYEGGQIMARYLIKKGYQESLFAAESIKGSNYVRWIGFKEEHELQGLTCNKDRYLNLTHDKDYRIYMLNKALPALLSRHKAIAFTADFNAIEAMNYFYDLKINVPGQISVMGFDDNLYSSYVRPRLTTVHQDISLKGRVAVQRLIKVIKNEPLDEQEIRFPVHLVERDSVIPNSH